MGYAATSRTKRRALVRNHCACTHPTRAHRGHVRPRRLRPACTGTDGNTQTTYATSGTCSAGSCSYTPTDTPCMFGCANGAMQARPPCWGGVHHTASRDLQATRTLGLRMRRVGTCAAPGRCSYGAGRTPRAGATSNAAEPGCVLNARRIRASWGQPARQRGGGTPKCYDLGTIVCSVARVCRMLTVAVRRRAATRARMFAARHLPVLG